MLLVRTIKILFVCFILLMSGTAFSKSNPLAPKKIKNNSLKITPIKNSNARLPTQLSKKSYVSPKPNVERVLQGSLWYEQLRAPAGTATLILLNSNYAVCKTHSELDSGKVQKQIVVQFTSKELNKTFKGRIAEVDVETGLMLVRITNPESLLNMTQLSQQESLRLAQTYSFGVQNRAHELQNALHRFHDFSTIRDVASSEMFPSLIEQAVKTYADIKIQSLIESEKKMSWDKAVVIPLPGVESCSTDHSFKKKILKKENIQVVDAYVCYSSNTSRELASLKPMYTISTGIFNSRESFPSTTSFSVEMNKVSIALETVADGFSEADKSCISNWVQQHNIWTKSCITKSDAVAKLYDGIHTFGFYKNKKLIYESIYLKNFSADNHKSVVDKFLTELRGSYL